MKVRMQRLPHAGDLPLPGPATAHSAGADLRAAVEGTVVLAPGERRLIPTGFVWEIPVGWEGQVRPRSGLALQHGVTCLNSPGTVDSDYRGEVCVVLANLGSAPFAIERGMRIAQLVLAAAARWEAEEVPELGRTDRGAGGFGHTGTA